MTFSGTGEGNYQWGPPDEGWVIMYVQQLGQSRRDGECISLRYILNTQSQFDVEELRIESATETI